MTRKIDEFGFMHIDDLSNISKEQVREYLGSEIKPSADAAGVNVNPDRIYGLYCPASALIDSVDAWNGAQLKLEHHFGTADDPATEHVIGSVYNATFEAPFLKGGLLINDGRAQELIESGEYKELSASYGFDLVNKSGKFNGIEYDFEMANIRPNHVAIVDKGRAGPECCVADELKPNLRSKLMDFIDAVVEVLKGKRTGEEVPPADPETPPPPTNDNAEAIIAAIEGVDPAVAEALRQALAGGAGDEADPETPPVGDEADPETPPVGDEADPETPPKAAMDAALIRRIEDNAVKKVVNLFAAAQTVKQIVGDVNPLAYKTPEDIYALALKAKNIKPEKYPRAAWRGMVDMAVADSVVKIKAPVVSRTKYDASIFPHINKKGV